MLRNKCLIAVIGFISLAVVSQTSLALEEPKKTEEVTYILISSKDLEHVNTVLRSSIKALFPDSRETFLNYNSEQARKYIEELEIKFVPFVIFDDSIATSDRFFGMVRNKMISKIKGRYVIPDEQLKMGEIMFLERKRQLRKLSIFAESFSPYAQEAEAALINFIRQNKLNIDVSVKYLVDFNEFGIFSPRGPEEIREDLRQIIIEKYYPDKFLDYLLLIQNRNPEQLLEELGISLEDIEARKDEALNLLKQDYEESKTLGIIYSPVFLWENVYLVPNLQVLKQHSPFNIRKVRVGAISRERLPGPVPIEFFFSDACHSCRKVKEDVLPQIESKYKDKITINYHDVTDREEYKLKLALEKEYGVLKGGIPEIFLPTVALEGMNSIKENLASAIEEILEQKVKPAAEKKTPEADPILSKFFTFSPAVVAFAGLADGINPCAFATIVFFVSFLALNSFRKEQITYISSSFIFAVFLTYLALGLGIFQALRKLQAFSFWSQLVYFAVAFLALGVGIYNLCDYIKYKRTGQTRGCSLKLYNRLRALADNRRALIILIIAAFINGVIIALLESACTGQVYLPTIAFVMKVPHLRLHAFLYLVLYNLLFIIPLIFVFLLAYRGVASEKFAAFTEKHYGGIKIAYVVLFFSLALLLFIF